MSAQNRKSNRRKGQAMVRTGLLGLGLAGAGGLALWLSGVYGREAVILPGIVMGLVILSVSLRGRARSRREWSAAWDAYSECEISRESFESSPDQEILSFTCYN